MVQTNEVKKILKKSAVILTLLVVGDQSAGALLDFILGHSPDGRYFKARYSLEQCDEDIIILGSSRGEINYVPQIIEDSLGMSCWDAGRGGQEIPYFRCIQEGILKRYSPKIAIINVEPYFFEYNLDTAYQRVGFLRPFYKNHTEIQPIMDRISPSEKWFMKSRLYAYNSSFYYLLRPYFFHDIDGKVGDKGWKPREEKLNPKLVRGTTDLVINNQMEPEAVSEFEVLVKKFEERNCSVFLVISPDYARRVETSSSINYLRQFSKTHGVPLLMHSTDESLISHAELFTDPDHLNKEGAIIFTKKLCTEIKYFLKKETGAPVFTRMPSQD